MSAGFVAIFIGASCLYETRDNRALYGASCHVILQWFAVYITLGSTSMPELLIERLRKLQRQRGDVSPFKSTNEFLQWADNVLPLLSFNSVLQNEFKSAVRASNINLSAEGKSSNVNRAIGIVNQAVTSLEIVPEPQPHDSTAKKELKPSKFKKWLGEIGEKVFIALIVGAIGYIALHYFLPLIT